MTSRRQRRLAAPIVKANAARIAEAARRLRDGGLVAFPTETVYGLGGDATNRAAVEAIFTAKGRPRRNPLIIHVADADQALSQVESGPPARRLAARFWPGGLTLVLRRRATSSIAPLACAGLPTVAVRVPSHRVALRLLHAVGRPLAAPSANRFGAVSPTTARHVAQSLGQAVALILDGGRCPIGVESTVLDLSQRRPRLLRPGAVPAEAIEAEIGPIARLEPGRSPGPAPRSPGLMARHYAPELPIRIGVTAVRADEALLAFGPGAPTGAAATLNLSPAGDLEEAARNLYLMLRRVDRPPFRGIAVMAIPEVGLGLAINDRLRRAGGAK
ncbi:MAG: L-threonylcarbamoyladenylate synthase [Kiloniellales bacterium]